MQSKLAIFTDGSALGNPGPWGRAAVFVEWKKVTHYSWGLQHTTNNVMELTAVVATLRVLLGQKQDTPIAPMGFFGGTALATCDKHIELFTDSQYVQKWVTEWLQVWKARGRKLTWRGRPIQNVELRQELDYLLPYFTHLKRTRIKAHIWTTYNELADTLAKKASYAFAQ